MSKKNAKKLLNCCLALTVVSQKSHQTGRPSSPLHSMSLPWLKNLSTATLGGPGTVVMYLMKSLERTPLDSVTAHVELFIRSKTVFCFLKGRGL
jgi:hypothetical protein